MSSYTIISTCSMFKHGWQVWCCMALIYYLHMDHNICVLFCIVCMISMCMRIIVFNLRVYTHTLSLHDSGTGYFHYVILLVFPVTSIHIYSCFMMFRHVVYVFLRDTVLSWLGMRCNMFSHGRVVRGDTVLSWSDMWFICFYMSFLWLVYIYAAFSWSHI
jgi:hypothetical protein